MQFKSKFGWSLLCLALVPLRLAAQTQFTRDFAALEGLVKPMEQPFRQEICLNGSWQFQPMPIPDGYQRNQGNPPELAPPSDHWEATPIRIPSPWNANVYNTGRNTGAGSAHPYWPDSVWFPSYPEAWDGAQMGWLRRTFRVPANWEGKRVLLHFQAVAGGCLVLVNGKLAGEHFENFLPFELDVTDLINRAGDNELLVGVRSPNLYRKSNSLNRENVTFSPGSYLDPIVGIWQDVYLLGVAPVHVTDAFVQPWVDRGELLVETTLRNDTPQAQTVTLSGEVRPWINDAGKDILSAPEPKWHLADSVLSLPVQTVQIPAGTNITVVLKASVKNQLRLWSPDTPNLYGAVLSVKSGGAVTDVRYQRFGWRQFRIRGSDLLLNGDKFQIFADILHPFGVVVHSRRHAYAWFKMIKDVGGNGVRLHAQPWPSYYQDMADEMGLVALAETGLFGSAGALSFTEDITWQRFNEHYDGMILRDRNHPSVFGWSFGNEIFNIFDRSNLSPAEKDKYYAKLSEFGRRGLKLDLTREWISCDGDEDLRGTMPVWAKHFGLGLPLDRIPKLDKPLMVGESGGTYYATPAQLAVFNGDRAYESYAGRNEALAIDVYQNIVKMARPGLTFFSPSELSWFGIEHLPLGYKDFTRLPTLKDGVFFKPFEEGKPGMQPERISPYCTAFNPGFDPSLPLYRPLAMFDAMKAALAKGGPLPSPWDHKTVTSARPPATNETPVVSVNFLGDRAAKLFTTLTALEVPFTVATEDGTAKMLIVDGESLTPEMARGAKPAFDALLARGSQVLICFHRPEASVAPVNLLLAAPVALTPREATALDRGEEHPWNVPFWLADLYFAENADNRVLKCGLDGEFVRSGKVILRASNTDWSQFNRVTESAKCGATVLYEQLIKPPGAALVQAKQGRGTVAISTIEYATVNPAYSGLWRSLLNRMGVRLGKVATLNGGPTERTGNLLLDGPKQ